MLYYEGWMLFVLVLLGIVFEVEFNDRPREPLGVWGLIFVVLFQLWMASVVFRMLLEVKR